jgi:hypothetical protein
MTPIVKFAFMPLKYAPKRKMVNFAAPQWKTKIGEFQDIEIMTWVNNVYQNKVFPTSKDFNTAYDHAISIGLKPSEMVCWRNKTMILTREDILQFEEEFEDEKTVIKNMKVALETGDKVIFVY